MRVEEMIGMFEERLAWVQKNRPQKSKLYATEVMLQYLRRVARAKEEGKPLAWISLAFPVELLHAMDVVPFCPEQYAIQCIVSLKKYEYFELGWGYGFNREACSSHPATIGMTLSGKLPQPDLLLCSGPSPCDSSNMMFEVLSDLIQCPTFYLSHPYGSSEGKVEHYLKELESLIAFIELHTDCRFRDEGRLRALLENCKLITRYDQATQKLRKRVPCPMHGKTAGEGWGYRTMSEGLPETVGYFQALYEEVKEVADRGEGAIPEERYRVMVNGVAPFWGMKLFDWMEEKYKAIVVSDWGNLLSYMVTPEDTSDPLRCLAQKAHTGSTLEFAPYTDTLEESIPRVAQEAQVNASLFFAHFGCIVNCGYVRQVMDDLKVVGVPTAVMDVDACNPLVVSEAQLRVKIDEYFQMLEQQSSGQLRDRQAESAPGKTEEEPSVVSVR